MSIGGPKIRGFLSVNTLIRYSLVSIWFHIACRMISFEISRVIKPRIKRHKWQGERRASEISKQTFCKLWNQMETTLYQTRRLLRRSLRLPKRKWAQGCKGLAFSYRGEEGWCNWDIPCTIFSWPSPKVLQSLHWPSPTPYPEVYLLPCLNWKESRPIKGCIPNNIKYFLFYIFTLSLCCY